MTAEEFIVKEIQDERMRNRWLEEDVRCLKNELDAKTAILNRLVSKMLINHSENYGDYIVFDRFPDEKGDPELFAEIKKIMNKGEA